MSTTLRAELGRLLSAIPSKNDRINRAASTIYIVATSPEFFGAAMKPRRPTSITRRDVLLAGRRVDPPQPASRHRTAFTHMLGTTAPFTDYRALVCVFLAGGNDSFQHAGAA